jgi:uncharacterized protein (DUF302 family)
MTIFNIKTIITAAVLGFTLSGCGAGPENLQRDVDLIAVDERVVLVSKKAEKQNLTELLIIDHSRLAKKEEAELAASRVALYSDIALNTDLVAQNTLVGLDLPFRVISYAEDDLIKTMYTDATFLQKRHNLSDTIALQDFQTKVSELVKDIPDAQPVNSNALNLNYGIIKIESDYDFETTISNLKRAVLKEEDTIWFINLDYKAEAAKIGKTLPNATLLVFGAPAPGATAMSDFPSIGLDAFGQKVLVYVEEGKVIVAYNDIVDMSQLHYQDNALAHRVINFRLGKTLSNAVEK